MLVAYTIWILQSYILKIFAHCHLKIPLFQLFQSEFSDKCSERNSDRQLQILGKDDTCHLMRVHEHIDSRRILIWSFVEADAFAFLSIHDTYLKSWILVGFCQILASLEEFSKRGICDSSRILTDKSSGIIINTVTVGFCWKFEITGSLCTP